MKEFARGTRSIVYLRKKAIIKKENPKSKAVNRINNEAYWLNILNKHGIGPKLIKSKENEIMMQFIDGLPIIDWIKRNKKDDVKFVLINILKQCRILDKLHVNKYEMTNPYKHIIIKDKNPVLIDFEKCRYSKRPKNVTQFCQFMISKRINYLLENKGLIIDKISLMAILKMYKKFQREEFFDELLNLLR